MFYYSRLLTWIVLAALPGLHRCFRRSRRRCFRRRLDEKFNRGAENQAFLVESVSGIETIKAMAVEPQMQRRWEEQLAGYVAASFSVAHARQLDQPDACSSSASWSRRRRCTSARGW